MFSQLTDVAPKALLVGLGIWGIAHWAFIGGEFAKRQLVADGHVAICEQGYSAQMLSQQEQALAAIPEPRIDPHRENAAAQIRQTMRSPFGDALNLPGMNFGSAIEGTLHAYEQEKQQAFDAYDRMVDVVKQRTEVRLSNVGDFCGCLVTETISANQNEFAILTGTLGFVRPNKIADLDAAMARTQSAGLCNHIGERS